MTKTDAIRTARRAVSIHGARTDWVIIGPHDRGNPRGPSTEVRADSYEKALARSTAWKAEVALGLMGRLTKASSDAVDWEMYRPDGARTVEALVRIGLDAPSYD